MTEPTQGAPAVSRRTLVAGASALAAVASVRPGPARAQPAARYRRHNVASPAGQAMLASYKIAIRKMLALPPSDPRNWYTHALVHTVDCPHGNWWFVVWHRGYLGWFEQVCRDLSGDPNFAFPYWDWTANPQVPAAMFDDVLSPTDPAFIASLSAFQTQFTPRLDSFWNNLTPAQNSELLVRGERFPADLWFDIGPKGGPMFFPLANARGSTPARPGFDNITAAAVSQPTLTAALKPTDFLGFASPKTLYHSNVSGFGVMEGQPHNKVHNCTGGIWTDPNGHTTYGDGFMQANLSPVDPLFFLHHSNIDRLWDVWTRKQQAMGGPTLPDDNPGPYDKLGDRARWRQEPFLFFTDVTGNPVPASQAMAGAYETIGAFNYDYEPGSGEEVIPRTAPALRGAVRAPAPQTFAARLRMPGPQSLAVAEAAVPAALLARAAQPGGPVMIATITIALPPLEHGHDIAVMVNTPEDAPGDPTDPGFVTTLSMFGRHVVHGPVSFDVPINRTLTALSARSRLAAANPLSIRVVRLAGGAMNAMHDQAAGQAAALQVLDIRVRAY